MPGGVVHAHGFGEAEEQDQDCGEEKGHRDNEADHPGNAATDSPVPDVPEAGDKQAHSGGEADFGAIHGTKIK